jgi:hypothetical protein
VFAKRIKSSLRPRPAPANMAPPQAEANAPSS